MVRIPIADGIALNVIRSDKFKTNLVEFTFSLPLSEENASYASLLPAVLRRGCEKYPTMLELNRRLEELYAARLDVSSAKIGENEVVFFSVNMLRNEFTFEKSDLLSETLDILTELIFRPYLPDGVFCPEYVESEKKNLCDKIAAEINNKASYANKRLLEVMCEGEPYAVSQLGVPECVETITPASLARFYFDAFAKAPLEIFMIGVCDEEAMAKRLQKTLCAYARTAAQPVRTVIRDAAGDVKRVCEEMPVAQGKLALGFRTGASIGQGNDAAFFLFNEIFGGSPTSKLFENVREKKSLCYYCSSRFVAHKGIMQIASGVKVGSEAAAEEEILVQLRAMQNGDFCAEDVSDALRSLANRYLSLGDEPSSLAFWHLSQILAGLCERTPEALIASLGRVTKDEIVDMAKSVRLDTVYFLKGTLPEDAEDGGEEDA